jgi:hypothetical protein
MSGRQYFFIERSSEVEELENLLGGVPSGVPIAAM